MSAVEGWFEDLPEEWREAASAVRNMLVEASPQMKEEWKYKLPFYSHRRWMCYFSLQKHGLLLGFVEGVHLLDPDNLFAATSHKQIRHYMIPIDPREIPMDRLHGLVQDAIAWNDQLVAQQMIKKQRRS